MRNLPPRMSNQPARKAWEIEMSAEEFTRQAAKSHRERSVANAAAAALHHNPLCKNLDLYDDTGHRIAYRGAWIARGGRG